ncbi:Putative HlyD family secretion protein [Salmonella enterica subsp. enterica]|uniref:HlyD family secretion protein n=1 Tax=Salmonella enterica I TaxID=59201 RepID=A0A379W5U3_SALET|nr:Putative HlyD family secretion protein [Salmonella enterica subsp. enterica]
MKINQHDAAMDDFDIQRERAFSGAGRIVLICSLYFSFSASGRVWPTG